MKWCRWACYLLLLALLPACSSGSSDSAPPPASDGYVLRIESAHGAVAVEPQLARYPAGTRVTLTVRPEATYDFVGWSGDVVSSEHPLTLVMNADQALTANYSRFVVARYYVDFANGSDSQDGLSTATAWKHAPGDPQATDVAAATVLVPGSEVRFKGDTVYRGQIHMPASGSLEHPIVYSGEDWPGLEGHRAILDGSELVTGWTRCQSAAECGGNPAYQNIYWATVDGSYPALDLNLHEYNASSGQDEFLWLTQDPAPADRYFYDEHAGFHPLAQSNMTLTSITDASVFQASDTHYWDEASLLIWINPNQVAVRRISAYDPANHQVSFVALPADALYADGRAQAYAIYNSIHLLDQAGEYCVQQTLEADGRRKIFLWPRDTASLAGGISYSVRKFGINIANNSHLEIRGFQIQKFTGNSGTEGIAIGSFSHGGEQKAHIAVRNNLIRHNRKGGDGSGNGGIYLRNVQQSQVENNVLQENPKQAGIFISTGKDIVIRNNTVSRSGATSIRLYTVDLGRVIGNRVDESLGSHANGMTFYIACHDILVANNRVSRSNTPITFQDSGNLYFINNLIDGEEVAGRQLVSEWGDTSRGPWRYGTIAFFYNTFIRSESNTAIGFHGFNAQNDYLMINNILDGGPNQTRVDHRHNLYTGLAWNQESPWALGVGEAVEANLGAIFTNVAGGDYSLMASSPARAAGIELGDLFPSAVFPEFDWRLDINGRPRNARDIGAVAAE